MTYQIMFQDKEGNQEYLMLSTTSRQTARLQASRIADRTISEFKVYLQSVNHSGIVTFVNREGDSGYGKAW